MMKKILARILQKPKSYVSWLFIVIAAITFCIMGAFGYLNPIIKSLDSKMLTFEIGAFSFSIYELIKAIFVLILFIWLTQSLTTYGEKYIRKLSAIKLANRVILIKIFQIAVYFILFFTIMSIYGIDLSALAFLSSAFIFGISFGLQKIASNYISGLILLLEKSIKEGDLIEIDKEITGFVTQIAARHTLVETFSGMEIMIPNDDFISHKVTNFTYSNRKGRIEIKFGVSYSSDLELAIKVALESASSHELCSDNKLPVCYVTEFADSSINLVLFFWTDDVTNKRLALKSDVMRNLWSNFKNNNISIPFPQRDVNVKYSSQNN